MTENILVVLPFGFFFDVTIEVTGRQSKIRKVYSSVMLILFCHLIICELILKLIIIQVMKKLKMEALAFHSSKNVSF